MTDDFDREVDEWFDELEERLAPAGRHTPPDPDDEGATETSRPDLSDSSAPVPRRLVMPGVRLAPQPVTPESDPDPETMGLARREAQLAGQRRELVRTEALVDVMKELASEIRSVRRDVDQIKAIIARLRRLAEARNRELAKSPTIGPIHPET